MSRLTLLVLTVASLAALQAHGRPIEMTRNDTVVPGPGNDVVGGGWCQYKVAVRTGAGMWAGTSSKITFGLYDKTTGFTFTGTPFRARSEHTITTSAACISPCYLYVATDGAGPHPDWYCESVNVVVSGELSGERMFAVNTWIGPGRGSITHLHLNECFGVAKPAVSSS